MADISTLKSSCESVLTPRAGIFGSASDGDCEVTLQNWGEKPILRKKIGFITWPLVDGATPSCRCVHKSYGIRRMPTTLGTLWFLA